MTFNVYCWTTEKNHYYNKYLDIGANLKIKNVNLICVNFDTENNFLTNKHNNLLHCYNN